MMEKRISLLHVEDDPEYAKFFSMFLQKLASKDDGVSLDITAARSTEDAISLCKAHNYDCIVSGHKRGDESGRGLMEAVRQIHPDIPVIFLMGQEDGQVARKAFAQGASDYLSNDREIIPYERIFHSIINQAAHYYNKRRGHGIIQALHKKEMAFLISSGLDLLHVALGEGIFDTIKEHLAQIADGNIIILAQYDAMVDLFTIRTVMVDDIMAPDEKEIFFQLESLALKIDVQDLERLRANKFVSYEMDTSIFTCGTANMGQMGRAAASKGITHVEVMPLINSSTIYGIIMVMNPNNTPSMGNRLLEAYIIQASVAIDRHMAETNLLCQERLYHEYVNNSPDPVFAIDTTGTYIDVNPATITLTGYKKEELVGMNIIDIIEKEYVDIARHAFDTIVDKRMLSIELPINRKDGNTRWVKIDSVKLDSNRSIVFCKDITDQKQALAHTGRLHNLLMSIRALDQLIARATDMGIFLQDALESLVDSGTYDSGWIVRLDEKGTVFDVWHHHTPCPEEFNELLENGNPVPCFREALKRDSLVYSDHCETDICATCPFISTYPQNISFTKKIVCEGSTCGVISLQLPEKYGQMEDEHRLFNEITDEIAFAMELIANKERQAHIGRALRMQRKELSKFAHIISHDVRNDLHAIKYYAEYTDIPAVHRFERISKKVDDVSSFLEKSILLADSGKILGEPESIALQNIVDSCIEVFSSRDVTITNTKMPVMWTDPVKIREVFLNVINNAIHHGNATKVHIASELTESGMRITFTDNGSGIPAEMLPTLFEWGASSNEKNQGIGLAVIKHIVRAHGGVVAAWNNENGATISLRFPHLAIDMMSWGVRA